jgi:TRAP transporter TAXI family solute receptor
MRYAALLISALLFVALPVSSADILIGSGNKVGVYYQAARALCRVAAESRRNEKCAVLESAGSVANLTNVQNGSIEFGLVQSDMQHYAVTTSGPFSFVDTSFDQIRSLFSLHAEPFTLIVRNDAGIDSLDALEGRRLNIGNPGSGHRALMEVVMQERGWSKDDFQLVTELPPSQQAMALCHNRVEALIYTVGHPNPSVGRMLKLCDADIAEVSGPVVEKLITTLPYYAAVEIPADSYGGLDKPVPTFGVLATLVTSAKTDETMVYDFVKNLFERLDRFKRMHRVFRDLQPDGMINRGLSAPLHPGALRYYRERGWIGD